MGNKNGAATPLAVYSDIETERSARSAADLALQTQISMYVGQIGSKCEVVFGSYTGDGEASRFISLGFTPKALICAHSDGTIINGNRIQGGIILPATSGGLTIETNGFRALYSSDRFWTNRSNHQYYYIAFK